MNTENDKDPLKDLQEASNLFNQAMKLIEKDQEAYWESLSKEDQLKAFCAVVRRIYQAELVDQGSYRYALYNVFGFGPESYAQAQVAGYLSLHNAIFSAEHEDRLLLAFCKKYGIEDAQKKVTEFLK